MSTFYRCMLLLLIALLHESCFAMPVVKISPGFADISSFEDFEFLEDPTQSKTLKQIRATPSEKFSKLVVNRFQGPFSSSAFWLRTSLRNIGPEPVEWVLQHKLATTDYVEFWVLLDGKIAAHAVGGDRTYSTEREIPYRKPAIRFVSPAGKDVEVYVHLWNRNTAEVRLSFELSTVREFLTQMSVDNLRQGVIYGIPLALAFYAVVSWLVLGDRRFALYACYTVSMLGALAGLNGQMTDFFFTDAPDLANDLLHIFALLSLIFSFKFAQAFLRLPILLPRLNLLFRIVIWIAVGGILLRIVGIYAPVTMLTVMLMPCTVLTPIAAALIYCQGVRYARWYILAQSIFAGMTVYGIIGIQFIWFTNNTLHYVQMVFLGELIFLAIAQQDRWRFQQQQQREAEERYQDELQKRIQLLNQQAKERVQALEQAQERSKLLDEVREVTKLVAAGHFDIRMTDSKNIDMSELVCSINSMAESLSKLEHDRRLWIAKASHELRTPLSVLQGELELLHDGFRKLDPAAVESLQEEVIHLSRLVNDLHDLAISYAQNLSCNFTEWNLCALVREVGRRYKELAAAKGITLWTVTHENQIEVKWDKGRIQQLLENLLNNSICYTDAPGSIELCVDAFPGYAAITIQDSAPGVSAEEMHMLSQPFFRSHVVSLSRKSGSGLGLAICAAIVEAHGGQISIVQSPLGGVAVKATIPLNTTASATNMQAPQPVSRIGDEAVQDEPVEAPHAAMEDISNKLLAKQGGA